MIGGIIRSEPSQTDGEDIVELDRGETVEVVEGKPGYLLVVHDDKKGWLSKRMVAGSLRDLDFDGNRDIFPDLIDGETRLRKDPVDGKVIARLYRGDTVRVNGRGEYSLRAVYGEKEGWIPRRNVMDAEEVRRYEDQLSALPNAVIPLSKVTYSRPNTLFAESEVGDTVSLDDTLQVLRKVTTGGRTALKVRNDGKSGWMSEKMIMTEGEARKARSENRKQETESASSREVDRGQLPLTLIVLVSVFGWGILSFAVGRLAERRGADQTLWMIVSLLISPPLGFVVLVASTAKTGEG